MGSTMFKCGEDDDGDNIKLKLRHFIKYTFSNTDDSPLYVFDSKTLDSRAPSVISRGYKPPDYFREDLFEWVGEKRRPPYKWFLVGPERSGTTVHIDPLHTSAWNTLIKGRKRWVLFPPKVAKSVVKGKGLWEEGEDDEAVNYFEKVLIRIKEKVRSFCRDINVKTIYCI